MTNQVLVEITDGVATITINRPEARNALNREVRRGLPAAIEACEADDAVDVMILTGADPAFSAGVDLKEIGAGAAPATRSGPVHPRGHPSRGRGHGSRSTWAAGLPTGGCPWRGALPAAHEAPHRRGERGGRHWWTRARAGVRLPRRLRARAIRGHPRPRRRDARLGTHGAPSATSRRRACAGDERHRQLRRRRARVRMGLGQPCRGARRTCCRTAGSSQRTAARSTSSPCAACCRPTTATAS